MNSTTNSINNVDIQAILNEINDDDDDEFLLHYQDSLADISSLSIGGVTNAFHFAPAQISAAVTSSEQQRFSYNKGSRSTPIKANKRREIDIEQILRECDECDNAEDAVTALLNQQLPHHHQSPHFLDEDDGSTIESYSLTLSKFIGDSKIQPDYATYSNKAKQKLPQQVKDMSSSTEGEDDSESWVTNSEATTTTTSDEDIDYLSKSTISTKAGIGDHHHLRSDFFTTTSKTNAGKPLSKANRTSSDIMADARDWAVLQSILAENDDNEDDDHNSQNFTMLIKNTSAQLAAGRIVANNREKKPKYEKSINFSVDTILQDDDDDFDDNDQHVHNSIIKPITAPLLPDKSTVSQQADPVKNNSTSSLIGKPQLIPTTADSAPKGVTNASSTSIDFSFTTAAMTHAQLYENRLLHGHQQQHQANNNSGTFSLVSPLSVKRRMKPKIELWTKSRQKNSQQQDHSTLGRYEFSGGAVNVTCLSQISNHMTRTSALALHNLPTALAISSKFICIGTQSGSIYIYDMFQEKRQVLEPSDGASVTSIDINGETLLLAGYSTGTIILWDAFTGKPLRTCTDLHASNSPITSIRFLPSTLEYANDNISNSKEDEGLHHYAAISVDASGLVNKLIFTKSLVGNLLLWGGIAGGYSVEVECLLDGSAGQILALEVLPSLSQIEKEWRDVYEKNKHFMRRIVLVGLSSIKSSFVVAVEPTICVLHRWSRQQQALTTSNHSEQNDSSSSTVLPCLTWGWSLVSGGGNIVHPILARSWGSTLQLLRANYINPVNAPADNGNTGAADRDSQQWPAFGVLSDDEFSADSAIVSLHWINERSLAYLTVNCEFTVIDTVCMTLIERFDFSQHKIVYAELRLPGGGKSKISNATFSNSIRSCIADQRLYITCQHSLIQISLQSTKNIIIEKEANGEWLQALALALDYYENYVQVLEDRLRQQDWDARGRDMRWHPELMRSGRMADADEWITKLLLRYLKLAVENAPVSHSAPRRLAGGATNSVTSRVDLTLSHYTMLAGICVEYCIGTRRLNVLYQQVYPTFLQSGYESVFFNVLEPYALKDALKYMSPEVMTAFVEHCKRSGDFESVERCLLHLDVTIMDFNSILPILKSNELYSALLHVFTHGLDDYVTPLEILLEVVMDAYEEIAPELRNASRCIDGVLQNKFEQFGYKALLYLTHCFQGRTFPWGSKIEPVERLQTLRPQVLKFLLQPWYNPSAEAKRCGRNHAISASSKVIGRRADPYPYLSILILVDAKAVLDLFSVIFDSKDVSYEESNFDCNAESGWGFDMIQPPPLALVKEEKELSSASKASICPDRQLMVSILASLIRPTENRDCAEISGTHPDNEAKNSFLDFIAKYLERGIIRVPKSLTHAVLTRLSQAASKLPQERSLAQGSIITLIHALPNDAYDLEQMLLVMEAERMTKVALLLHKIGADIGFLLSREGATFGVDVWEKSFAHFVRAIKCYINDSGTSAHTKDEIFEYVKTYYARLQRLVERMRVGDKIAAIFQKALLAIISKMVILDAVRSAQLVAELFIDDLGIIVDRLRQERGGEVLFNFLRAIASGQLSVFDPISGPVLMANLNADQHQLYLTLMAKFHPEMVYKYLLTKENCRIEECLKLCQEYNIPDATAYMMELSGNVSSALQLLLQTLESRIVALKRVIRSTSHQTSSTLKPQGTEGLSSTRSRKDAADEACPPHQTAVQRTKDILAAALDLCERNSEDNGADQSKERGPQLWFDVLDHLIKAKRIFRLTKEAPKNAELFSCVLNDLLQMTMQRMMSNVSLADLLQNVTIENNESSLGEFREILMSMLKAYSGELVICSCAVDVMHVDKKRMTTQKQQLKLQGMEVRSVMGNMLGGGMSLKRIPFHNSEAFFRVASNGDAIQHFFNTNVSVPVIPVEGSGISNDTSSRLRKLRQRYSHREDLSNALSIGNKHVGMLTDAEHFGSIGL